MALESISRWQLIREIICDRRSGTLIEQIGQTYLHWVIHAGNLVCVSSTSPEQSFLQFLLQHKQIDCGDLWRAQLKVAEHKSLGAVLVQIRAATVDGVKMLLRQYWCSLSPYLMLTAAHFFWSHRELASKSQFISVEVPFSQIILACERSSIEVSVAVRCGGKLPAAYRITDWSEVEAGLQEREKRMLHYLKTGASLAEILRDPELDKLTCYRVLFLLWASGLLYEVKPKLMRMIRTKPTVLLDRIKSVPADWIIPLFVGVAIGILLSPSAPPDQEKPAPPPKVERLKEVMENPAWSTEESDNTAADGRGVRK